MTTKLKYVYFGTPEISGQILKSLIEAKMPPVLLVCNPDKGSALPATKLVAHEYSIPVYQPEKLDAKELKEKISNAELGVLFAYGKIISQPVIDLFPKGILVIHPSLLPRLRGATPVPNVILEGEHETGTTILLMDNKVDHGPIVARATLQEDISRTTTTELFSKLIPLSAELIIKTLPEFINEKIMPSIQDETKATYTKRFSSDDGRVDLMKDESITVDRKIRALNPEPGTWTILNESLPREMCKVTLPLKKRIKLLEIVKGGDSFCITKIQIESKGIQEINIRLK